MGDSRVTDRGATIVQVLLISADQQLIDAVRRQFSRSRYLLKSYASLGAAQANITSDDVQAVIIDSRAVEIESLLELRAESVNLPALYSVVEPGDTSYRLALARMGGSRVYSNPPDVEQIYRSIDSLSLPEETEAYRVLIADGNSKRSIKYQSILTEAGFKVRAQSDVEFLLEDISTLEPDVILVGDALDGCSAPDLVKLLRQEDSLATRQYVFQSPSEQKSQQDHSLIQPGKYFIAADDTPEDIVAIISTRAQWWRRSEKYKLEVERVLHERDFRLSTLNQHAIVSEADTSGNITEVNDKFCETSGYSRDELIGKNHNLVRSDYHPESFYKDMWKTISQGHTWHGTICNRNKNGEDYWVDSTIVPYFDSNNKLFKYVSVRTDVTELRQSEERLNRSQSFANIGTWDWNVKTDELYWSDRI